MIDIIYFILFYQNKFDYIVKTFEDLDEELHVIINKIGVFTPNYKITNEDYAEIIETYFDQLMTNGTVNGKAIQQKDIDAVITTFTTIFKIPTICEVSPEVKYTGGADLQFIIKYGLDG